MRPPNAIEHRANQPHPRARPPSTSLSQWTPRSTREAATARAMNTAAPARSDCTLRDRPRPSHERERGSEARGGAGGVTARERRPERVRDRVGRRPHAVEQVLDLRAHDGLADGHRDQEQREPTARSPDHLHHEHADGEADDDPRGAERRHEVEHPLRERRHVLLAPRRDGLVDVQEARVRTHQESQHAQDHTADDQHDEREHEQETGLGLRVETGRHAQAAALRLAFEAAFEMVGDDACEGCGRQGRRPGDGGPRDRTRCPALGRARTEQG